MGYCNRYCIAVEGKITREPFPLPTYDSETWYSVITCSTAAALVANTVMRCATLHGTTSTQTTGTLRKVSGDYEMPATLTVIARAFV